jgi:RsiW-degrading membrane proteinase PrsW (M82 family)
MEAPQRAEPRKDASDSQRVEASDEDASTPALAGSAAADGEAPEPAVTATEPGCCLLWARHLLCCCCTDVFGGLAGYVLCLYGLVILAHRWPSVGLVLLAIAPPLLLLALCTLRHSDGLSGCQLVLTTACAVLWMSPLLLLQWALATTHVPVMLYALDPRCATCIELAGGYGGQYVDICSCWGKTFVQAFVISALPEELLKLVAVLGVANRTHIERPGALVMYAMAAAAGFAAVENMLYVIAAETPKDSGEGADSGATNTAVARAALCIPLHLTCGALIGVGLARWRWLSERGTPTRRLWTLVSMSGDTEGEGEGEGDGGSERGGCCCCCCCACACACYGGLSCGAALCIATPAILVHTAYDGLLMAPYSHYGVILGSTSHARHLYVRSHAPCNSSNSIAQHTVPGQRGKTKEQNWKKTKPLRERAPKFNLEDLKEPRALQSRTVSS